MELQIWFYEPKTYRGRLVSILTGSRLAHVVPVLHGVGYHVCLGGRSGWHYTDRLPKPDHVVTLDMPELDLGLVDLLLPKGRRFPLVRSVVHALAGGTPPLSCVGAVHRLLMLAGYPPKERLPDGLYRETLHLATALPVAPQPAGERA